MSESKYKIGQVVRYDKGATALFKIDHISKRHGGPLDRYYGRQFYGSPMGAYEDVISPASESEIKEYEARAQADNSAKAKP